MNKKIIIGIIIGVIVILLGIGSYFIINNNKSNTQESSNNNTTIEDNSKIIENNTNNDATTDKKVLVAYFSWSGNTESIANYIKENTNADIYEITPKTPYSTDYSTAGDVAKKERDDNARPEISNLPDSISGYDAIFIGYPIWWHTAPMIIGTFLNAYDFTGINIYPFTQSASMDTEQFNNSIDFVKENTKNGTVHNGLFASKSDTDKIDNYLTDNGF